MPIYEYKCPRCEEIMETLRRISERDQPMQCAACGSNALRVLSSANVLSGVGSEINQVPRPTETTGGSLRKGGLQITNCTFENSNIGISLPEGTNVTMRGNKFKNVKTPVEFRKK